MPQLLLVPLPDSLKILLLKDSNLDGREDHLLFHLTKHLPSFSKHMNFGSNPSMLMTNYTNHKMLRILDVSGCQNIKSLLCLPITLEELCTSWCSSPEKITFESAPFRLRKFEYLFCENLREVQGFFKLVPLAKVDEAELGHMKWIKAYDTNPDLIVGDGVSYHWHKHVLYEYGIMSTYFPCIKDQSMPMSEYMSSSTFLSFCVPPCPEKCRIQGLNVTASYRPSGTSLKDEDTWNAFFIKVSNTTKGLTWMYNPFIYCISGHGEDVGNILDAGDEINVSIIVGDGWMVSSCGASLVFIDDGEEEPKYYKNYKKEEEVIGGDLS